MESPNRTGVSSSFLISMKRTFAYGAIAGFIATWSISTAIAASELELGITIGTFYAVMGISLGSANPATAAYLGFGMHLATGSILGGIIGLLAVQVERWRRSNMSNIFNPYRAVVMGVGTGVLVWLVLFLPVTALLVQPSEAKIIATLSRSNALPESSGNINIISQSFTGIAISAVVFHVVWGAIFAFIINSLLRIRLSMSASSPPSLRQYSQLSDRSIRFALFGLAAGAISSIAISGLILLAERVISIPVGTFYYVLVSGLTNTYNTNIPAAVSAGLLMHLLAGSFMGLVMSIPFMMSKSDGRSPTKKAGFVQRYSPLYGLAFGFGIWLLVFMPVSYLVVVPQLNSFETNDVRISQRVPTGEATSATFFRLSAMTEQVLYGAIAFNMFYGMLVGIIIQSFSQKYLVPSSNRKQIQQQPSPDGASVT